MATMKHGTVAAVLNNDGWEYAGTATQEERPKKKAKTRAAEAVEALIEDAVAEATAHLHEEREALMRMNNQMKEESEGLKKANKGLEKKIWGPSGLEENIRSKEELLKVKDSHVRALIDTFKKAARVVKAFERTFPEKEETGNEERAEKAEYDNETKQMFNKLMADGTSRGVKMMELHAIFGQGLREIFHLTAEDYDSKVDELMRRERGSIAALNSCCMFFEHMLCVNWLALASFDGLDWLDNELLARLEKLRTHLKDEELYAWLLLATRLFQGPNSVHWAAARLAILPQSREYLRTACADIPREEDPEDSGFGATDLEKWDSDDIDSDTDTLE